MLDIDELQKRVLANKIAKGFNTTDIYKEFCYIYGEVSEACQSYLKKKEDVGEELADVIIYILGLCEILGINLEDELMRKIDINEKRKYIQQNGVNIRIETKE